MMSPRIVQRLWVLLTAATSLSLLGCTSNPLPLGLGLSGALDLVVVDHLPDDGTVASVVKGVPSRYVFVTSADLNHLAVLDTYNGRPVSGSPYAREALVGPNPLEALAIPVLDHPTMLVVDEGLSKEQGRRVTGRFVYAARAGGAQLSVVDATPKGFVSVTPSPLEVGAPITALVAWIGVDLTSIPETTSVYAATFDGADGAIARLTLPTQPERRAEVARVVPEELVVFPGEAVVDLAVVPPFSGRTLDGQPFCAGPSACLAVATRRSGGSDGRTLLFEVGTARTARLAFPGPVRSLQAPGVGERIHGVLDEAKCDATSCGGVLIVDARAGTTTEGFTVLMDFSGRPMRPLQAATGYIRDLAAATNHALLDVAKEEPLNLRQYTEVRDAGVLTYEARRVGHQELGAFTATNGETAIYDGVHGTFVDYDGRRAELTEAIVRTPQPLPDGGYALLLEDGGTNFVDLAVKLAMEVPLPDDGGIDLPFRIHTASVDDEAWREAQPFTVTLADGYWVDQSIYVEQQGDLPGLTGLATPASASSTLSFTPGLEDRVQVGDRVRFTQGLADGGTELCGEAGVTAVAVGSLTVSEVPSGCSSPSAYSVSAGGAQPLVITGDVEGFMTRAAPRETVTYRRRYVTRPNNFDGERPAMVMTVGDMPTPPKSFWRFSLSGNTKLYRVAFNFLSSSGYSTCTTAVGGAVLLRELPTSKFVYEWNLVTLFPTSDSLAMQPLGAAVADAFGAVTPGLNYAVCYR